MLWIPAFINYLLVEAGHRTLSVAVGDNLLQKSWIADLMRLNKSFTVKRNITAPRELMAASRQLAGFIRWMITENRGPIWIAQREGRAMDGLDATESAVIKMLSLSQDRKTETIGDRLTALNIVPVAISYELDPCDALKAVALAVGSDYTKAKGEDELALGLGVMGQKGCVHIGFGVPITAETLGLEREIEINDVVSAIDDHIRRHYRVFDTALWAWQRLHNTNERPDVDIYPGTISRQAFDARIDAMPASHRQYALALYANPLRCALDEFSGEINS